MRSISLLVCTVSYCCCNTNVHSYHADLVCSCNRLFIDASLYHVCSERSLEALVDKDVESRAMVSTSIAVNESTLGSNTGATKVDSDTLASAALRSIESVKGAEMLMEAMELVEQEMAIGIDSKDAPSSNNYPSHKAHSNPLLLGLSPLRYMMRTIRSIKAPDLEQALLMLPFHYVCRLISLLVQVLLILGFIRCSLMYFISVANFMFCEYHRSNSYLRQDWMWNYAVKVPSF